MINKFFKLIHNKYSRFLRFIFFLRYLFAIFFISIGLFLTIPNFFNYEKKAETIKRHLFETYNFKIQNYSNIEFYALPIPRIEFSNSDIKFDKSSIQVKAKSLKIYPKLFSIYNYKNYQSNKIILKDNNINLQTTDFDFVTKHLLNQKNKIVLDNMNFNIKDKNKLLLKLRNIQYSNFGYNKNLIKGEIFKKKFKIKTNDNLNDIKFEIIKSGIVADINFNDRKKNSTLSGVFKSKILNTNLKFDFEYKDKLFNIYNSYFRSKNLSFSNNSSIKFDPFLDLNSEFIIENIDAKIFGKPDIKLLFKEKNIIKKINSKNIFYFKAKKFNRNLIDELNLKVDLAYGRMNYLKNFSVSDNFFSCKGNINFLEEYPLLYFDCSFILNDKKKLLKFFSIKQKNVIKLDKLEINGNFSILNKKINFKKISADNYEASKEDLKYFKDSFQNIVFNESFYEIFDSKKIAKFILEVS